MGEMGCLGGEIEYQAPDPVRAQLKQSQVAQRLHILNAGDLSSSKRIKCEIWEQRRATCGRNVWVGGS